MVTRKYARMTAAIDDVNRRIDPLEQCDSFRGLLLSSGMPTSSTID